MYIKRCELETKDQVTEASWRGSYSRWSRVFSQHCRWGWMLGDFAAVDCSNSLVAWCECRQKSTRSVCRCQCPSLLSNSDYCMQGHMHHVIKRCYCCETDLQEVRLTPKVVPLMWCSNFTSVGILWTLLVRVLSLLPSSIFFPPSLAFQGITWNLSGHALCELWQGVV